MLANKLAVTYVSIKSSLQSSVIFRVNCFAQFYRDGIWCKNQLVLVIRDLDPSFVV